MCFTRLVQRTPVEAIILNVMCVCVESKGKHANRQTSIIIDGDDDDVPRKKGYYCSI